MNLNAQDNQLLAALNPSQWPSDVRALAFFILIVLALGAFDVTRPYAPWVGLAIVAVWIANFKQSQGG